MDCGLTFAKYSVFIFNFLFAIAGIAMIAIGAVANNQVVHWDDFLDGNLTAPTILLIVVGCIVFLIAFLGCCGAIKENTCMLYLFAIVMLLIIAGEIAIIWTAYSHKGKVEDFLDKKLTETLNESLNVPKFYKSWDALQREFGCCGVNNYNDWIRPNNTNIPPSCCAMPAGSHCPESAVINTKGCKQMLIDFVNENTVKVAGLAIGVGVFQLLGVIFTCCLYSSYRRNHY